MAKGSDLPNEVLQEVINYLHPSTIVNFAVSCHLFHSLSTRNLARHRNRIRSFRILDTERGFRDIVLGPQRRTRIIGRGRMTTLIRKTLEPSLEAWYVRDLVVRFHLEGFDIIRGPQASGRGSQAAEALRQENIRLLGNKLNSTLEAMEPYPNTHVMRRALTQESVHLLSSLLLFNLPNLQSLHWDDQGPVDNAPLLDTMRSVAMNPNVDALSNLRVLILDSSRPRQLGEAIPFMFIQSCLRLPSLEIIKARSISWTDRLDERVPEGTSNVSWIELTHNQIIADGPNEDIEQLIAAPRNLRHFAFSTAQGDGTVEVSEFLTEDLVSMLIAHAGDTLETLAVRAGFIEAKPLLNLTAFNSLRYLETDFCLLLPSPPMDPRIASSMLPRTLTHLRLYDDPFVPFEQGVAALLQLLSYRRAACPSLAQLDLGLDDHPGLQGDDTVPAYMREHAGRVEQSCQRKSIGYRAKYRTDTAVDPEWDRIGAGKWYREQNRNFDNDSFFT